MSAKTKQTIYIALLDEGVEVWRPVEAIEVGNGVYRIVSENQAPDDERWEFTTEELVRCVPKSFSDGSTYFVAVERHTL
jgi:hypothetical protein